MGWIRLDCGKSRFSTRSQLEFIQDVTEDGHREGVRQKENLGVENVRKAVRRRNREKSLHHVTKVKDDQKIPGNQLILKIQRMTAELFSDSTTT